MNVGLRIRQVLIGLFLAGMTTSVIAIWPNQEGTSASRSRPARGKTKIAKNRPSEGAAAIPVSAKNGRPGVYAIVLHGGAGSSPEKMGEKSRRGRELAVEKVLKKGLSILEDGGTSLDAVEQVIRAMEDDPIFNAGKGAVFNSAGGHELDASIMDGRDLSCGAVAGVKTIRNPISLARLVMTKTPHVLLAGDGADRFGKRMSVELVDQEYFSTDGARRRWERSRKRDKETAPPEQGSRNGRGSAKYYGTVGCVALDQYGNLARQPAD